MSSRNFALYYQALEMDDAFEAAIRAQFGSKATRWTVNHRFYDENTRAAYERMVASKESWIAEMRRNEQETAA